jgi:hypothetical protein
LAAERRSHSRLAAPAFLLLLLWGWHLWGCIIAKRGAPETDDTVAIQRYADLRAAESPPGFCEAVRTVAAQLRGDTKKHYERLRKKIRRLETRGLLPMGGSAGRQERQAAALRDLFVQREARIEKAKQDLVLAEQEATALGLDIGADIVVLKMDLRRKRDRLAEIAYSVDLAFEAYRSEGIEDPEQAVARLREDLQELPTIEKWIEVLDRISNLRQVAGVRILPHLGD